MDAWLQWFRDNPAVAQAFVGVALAVLTGVLIIVTGFYAWTTWRTMRLVKRDLVFRTRPYLDLKVGSPTKYAATKLGFSVFVTAKNAPAVLRNLLVIVMWKPGHKKQGEAELETVELGVMGHLVPAGETKEFIGMYEAAKFHDSWSAHIEYQDAIGLSAYRQAFVSDGLAGAWEFPQGSEAGLRLLLRWWSRLSGLSRLVRRG